MPPRVSAAQLPRTTTNSTPSICLRCLLQSRSISSTPSHQMRLNVKKPTRAQRAMRSWLNGPGAAFLQPVPGSTNYLGAYDKSGTLIRGKAGAPAGDEDDDEPSSRRQNRDENENEDENEEGNEEKEKQDVKSNSDDKNKMPPETVEDLRPFPLNPFFRSEPVLSEPFRDEIYRRVGEQGQTVREVSVSMNVTMERVAAVYRMKEMEKRRIAANKPLYLKYQQIVMDMLPQTKFDSKAKSTPRHENINDLPVHPSTLIQMFHPTSESRHFTRVDAGRIFHPNLKPADERIPHPEMIDAARDFTEGYNQSERTSRMKDRYTQMEEEIKEKERRRKAAEARRITTVEGKRWDFKFRDVSADVVGKDGRSRTAVGWRYGQPFEDRKKGQVKIPTRVD